MKRTVYLQRLLLVWVSSCLVGPVLAQRDVSGFNPDPGSPKHTAATIALLIGLFLLVLNTVLFYKKISAKDLETLKSSALILGIALFCFGCFAYFSF